MQKHVNKLDIKYVVNDRYGIIGKQGTVIYTHPDTVITRCWEKDWVFDIPRELLTPTKVIYNGNKTIVLWGDGDKTIVSCGDDEEFDNYTGFLAALAKKLYGSTSRAKKMVRRVTDDQRKPKPQKPQKTQNPVNWLAEIEAEIDKYIEDVTDHQNNYPTRKTHLGGSFI